jgi:short-chain fatty acids transporter
MLQPFWALALLGVTRLEARDILGYTTLVMLLTGPFYVVALLVR